MPSGTLFGKLTRSVAADAGVNRIPYALVGSHDTASATASVPVQPGEKNYAFCSSGTWSLFGIETDSPIMDDQMYRNNFSNEGTVQGGFRPLKNITGMWILQECIKKWNQTDRHFTYDDITEAVKQTQPLRCHIDVDHRDFFEVGNMPAKIQAYCSRTGQYIPETPGEIARCIYESLALKYRWTIEWLDNINKQRLEKLYIVGGGVRSCLLNQMAADCMGRPVVTGPAEGACMGNLLVQAMALGEISDISQLRDVVQRSSNVCTYVPDASAKDAWDEAYAKQLAISSAQL